MRIHNIIEGTTVDGPGFRTSIYVAGCQHHCKGCHNPQTWDMDGGYEVDIDTLIERVINAENDITLTGGDPLFQPIETALLCKNLKDRGFGIWLYTGFTYEEIVDRDIFKQILENIDVLVDGKFIDSLKDISLIFRGSSNQRLIDVDATNRNGGKIILWESDF